MKQLNKRYMKHLAIVLMMSLSLSAAQANQPGWTLEQCIDHALKKNIQLQQSEVNRENQAINLERAKNQRLPGVYGSASASSSYGQSMNKFGYYGYGNSQNYSGSISASVPLFNGLQISNTIKSQELNLKASMEELKEARESLAMAIASAYLQVLFNKELFQLAQDQEALSLRQLERYQNMAALGKIPEGQVSEVKALHANNQLEASRAESNLKMALLELAQLIELDDWDQFDIVEPVIELDTLSLSLTPADEIYHTAVAMKPVIKASEYRLEQNERQLKVAEGGYYPSLSLGAQYSNGYYGGGEPLTTQLGDNHRASIGLSLSVPIFNRMETRNSVKSAKLAIRNAELALENTKKTLYKEIQQAWFNASTALERYKASLESVKQSEIAFHFTEEKFNNARATAYEYDEVRTKLASARSNLLQAKYNFLFSIKILDFYQGDPLTL